jgi:hypothetical protein
MQNRGRTRMTNQSSTLLTEAAPNAGTAPDCLQRPLRSRFRQQGSASVRLLLETTQSMLHSMS